MKVTRLTQAPIGLGGKLLLILITVLSQALPSFAQPVCGPPLITCPGNMVVTLDAGECGMVFDFAVTATDVCDPNPQVVQTAGIDSGEVFPIGINTVFFTATNNIGLSASCSFDIVVNEFPNPTGVLACNDVVQISVPQDGLVIVGADDVLEGGLYGCYDDYLVNITTEEGVSIGNLLTCEHIGILLTVMVTNPDNNNACWGIIELEDKLPPVLNCPDRMVSCTRTPESATPPTRFDNCDSNPTLELLGVTPLDNDICDDNISIFQRFWRSQDKYGNVATCTDLVTIQRPTEVDFPDDRIWDCNQASLVSPSSSGSPSNVSGGSCKFNITFSDDRVFTCPGSTRAFDIIRTWTVVDWCTGEIITTGVGGEDNVQIIKVRDTTPPTISANNLIVDANIAGVHPSPCRSTEPFPSPSVTDNCTGIANININTAVGEIVNGRIPEPGLPIGYHIVTIQAFDRCGNVATKDIVLQVTDRIAPSPICVEYTEVGLESSGRAVVEAEAFNLASNDNCCVDKFLVRRMNEDPCDDGHNDLEFGPSVVFCCEDAGKTITVVLRVYDCFNNYNECMVQVLVNDKQFPVLVSCPPNQRITCDFYADNIETQIASLSTPAERSIFLDQFFGTPIFYDNCGLEIRRNLTSSIDQCLEGTIIRSFIASDLSGNTAVQPCTQTINIDHVSDWVIEFPADLTINCGATPPDFGEPEIFYETCELLAVTYDDETFNVVPDACYKIVRTWSIINWCVVGAEVDQEVVEQPENQLGLAFPQCDLDNDGDCDSRTFRDSWRGSVPVPNPFAPTAYRLRPFANDAHTPNTNPVLNFRNPDTDIDTDPWDGFITYQQVIKVNDNVDPVFTNGCSIPKICIEDNSCDVDVLLPIPNVNDCSPNVTVTAEINLGGIWVSGLGPHLNIPPGTYQVVYKAIDNCNNQSTCNTTVVVEDCKKPTPYCKNGIIVTLMNVFPPMVEVWASDLDDGSFDNCDEDLKLSFSADSTNTSITFNCFNQNTTTFVDIWVTDDAGNQAFCTTQITVQDNANGCADPLVNFISGRIANEEEEGIEGVQIHLNGDNNVSAETNGEGVYYLNGLDPGGDYTVVASHDVEPLNGVSTFDLVLISKHILGVTLLDSPYKIIAADANRSNSVTTFDLVEIRKLILFINEDFPNNTSWRFVDKDHVFTNTTNPWTSQIPELENFNDLTDDQLNTDFVAIKIGDVNVSAATNLAGSSDERNGNANLVIQIEDVLVEKGQIVRVPLNIKDESLVAIQFSLNFNKEKLSFEAVEDGMMTQEHFGFAKLEAGTLTASWNKLDGSAENLDGPISQLVFHASASGKLSEMLSIDSRYTKAEAYTIENEVKGISIEFNSSSKGYELLQNSPNPLTDQTIIGFNLPSSTYCTLSFTDVAGRELRMIEGTFGAGSHQIMVKRSELQSKGVVYYHLKTGDFKATKMMVITD
ncbi:MAG: HYR domain-containing protein [Saprospiraceae bacterium]|nr:HYR domain-containing protein [Saprospiraceae bacterium]